MNWKAHIREHRSARDGWLDILNGNPDNTEAARRIVEINAKLELLRTMKILDGDFDE